MEDGRCFDCDQPGHRRGSPLCPKKKGEVKEVGTEQEQGPEWEEAEVEDFYASEHEEGSDSEN